MMGDIFRATTVPALQEVVGFAQARHEILAGNIANLDTPGYRARDLSVAHFQQQLREAIEARQASRSGASGSAARLKQEAMSEAARESMRSILYHDESDVGLEQQVTELAKNQFLHNLAITIMHNQFQLMQVAISERV